MLRVRYGGTEREMELAEFQAEFERGTIPANAEVASRRIFGDNDWRAVTALKERISQSTAVRSARMSKAGYIAPIVVLDIIAIAFSLAGRYIGMYVFYGLSTMVWMMATYAAWKALPRSFARTSPGRAVGFQFIPIYGLYWAFQAYWGFAKDYNAWALASGNPRPAYLIQEWLPLTFCIISLLQLFLIWFPLLGGLLGVVEVVVQLWLLDRICDAVNNPPSTPDVSARRSS